MKVINRFLICVCVTAQLHSPVFPATNAAQQPQALQKDLPAHTKTVKSFKKRFSKENLFLFGSSLVLLGYALIKRPFKLYHRFTYDTLHIYQQHIPNALLEEIYEQPKNSVTAQNRELFINYLRLDLYTHEHQPTHFTHEVQELLDYQSYKVGLSQKKYSHQNSPYLKDECEICCIDEAMGHNYIRLSCDHIFCKNCLNKQFDAAMDERAIKTFCCLNKSCKKELTPSDALEVFKNNSQRLHTYYSAKLNDTLWCTKSSHEQCSTQNCIQVALTINRTESVAHCPRCDHYTCLKCLSQHSANVSCQEAEINQKDDVEGAEWVKNNTKPCPRCKAPILKNEGCAHMTCRNCRYEFWWCCMQYYDSHHMGHVCS